MPQEIPFSIRFWVFVNTPFWISVPLLLIGFVWGAFLLEWGQWHQAQLNSNAAFTRGQLVDVLPTGKYESDYEIFEFVYDYATPAGEAFTASSYSSGWDNLQVGDSVDVAFHPQTPGLSRIVGQRCGITAVVDLLVPFLAIAFGLLTGLVGLIQGLMQVSSFRRSVPAIAHFQSKVETSLQINEKPVFKITYRYLSPANQSFVAVKRTTNVDAVKQTEVILYDTQRPRHFRFFDELPKPAKMFVRQYFPKMELR